MASAAHDGAGEEMASAAESVASEENRGPEMAEDYNRFPMDLVEMEEPQLLESPILALIRQTTALKEQMRELKEMRERYERTGCLDPRCHNSEAPVNIIEIVKDSGNTIGEKRRLGSSGDEDVVIRGVIVAGGASSKRKNAARWRKRKLLREEEKIYNSCWQRL